MRSEILTSQQAGDQHLNVFQQAIYARYAAEGTYPEIGIQESHAGSQVSYIILRSDDPIPPKDFDGSPPHAQYKEVLSGFDRIFGFMSLETGPETEANHLVSKGEWPKIYTYVGDLVIHSYLDRNLKVTVQRELWKVAHGIIQLLPTYILTIDKVLKFAQTSGNVLTLQKDAKLKNRSNLVRKYKEQWPAYWLQKPRLYLVEKE